MMAYFTMGLLALAVGAVLFLCAKDAYRRFLMTKQQRLQEDAQPLDESW